MKAEQKTSVFDETSIVKVIEVKLSRGASLTEALIEAKILAEDWDATVRFEFFDKTFEVKESSVPDEIATAYLRHHPHPCIK